MSPAEAFSWALQVSDAEGIADAARGEGASDGLAQLIEQNCLLHQNMLATLRAAPFHFDDLQVAKAMVDPHQFADEVCEELSSPPPDQDDLGP